MSQQWENTDLIQMSVQTAEMRFEPHLDDPILFLSCSLVNIARGSCQLTLTATTPSPSAVCGELVISADRPVMSGSIAVSEKQFERMFQALRVSHARPVTLAVKLGDHLPVSLEGFLFIDDDQTSEIVSLQVNIPLK